MKKIFLLFPLMVLSLLITSCGTPGNPSDPLGDFPSDPEGYYPTLTPAPTATATPEPTPDLWDYSQVDETMCDGKLFSEWGIPGTYTVLHTWSGNKTSGGSELVTTESIGLYLTYPPDEDDCLHRYMSTMSFDLWNTIPTTGFATAHIESCITSESCPCSITLKRNERVLGFETLSTAMGEIEALKIEIELQQDHDCRSQNHGCTHIKETENSTYKSTYWFTCGYREIRRETEYHIYYYKSGALQDELMINNTWEVVSYSPSSTDEARVRYILADIAFGNIDYYRANVTSEAVAEALRRADAGITVTNLEQFERVLLNDTWTIVYAGTQTTVNGMDVKLSTDQ